MSSGEDGSLDRLTAALRFVFSTISGKISSSKQILKVEIKHSGSLTTAMVYLSSYENRLVTIVIKLNFLLSMWCALHTFERGWNFTYTNYFLRFLILLEK